MDYEKLLRMKEQLEEQRLGEYLSIAQEQI